MRNCTQHKADPFNKKLLYSKGPYLTFLQKKKKQKKEAKMHFLVKLKNKTFFFLKKKNSTFKSFISRQPGYKL
jgi:hypothetical protein